MSVLLTFILVPELTLEHINKQRVPLRPKRRPPTREFVRSRASMDFDFYVPEEIEEEDEDSGQNEATGDEAKVKPTPPIPAPKPAERNGWKLPTPGPDVVLRKTKSENVEEVKSDEVQEAEIEENTNDITPQSSPEKKQKERKRFKMHLFKFRRSRKGKLNGKTPKMETERKTNLTETYSMSVDSGLRPLGEDSRRRWPNRRSRRSEEKGLNWLLGIFHKKNPQQGPKDTKDAEHIPDDTEDVAKDAQDASQVHATGNHSDTNSNGKPEVNGTVPEVKLRNDHTSHEDDVNPDSVSDLRLKFERFSMVS